MTSRVLSRMRHAPGWARTVAYACVVAAAAIMLCVATPADAANFTPNQNAAMHLGGPDWTTVRTGTAGDRSLAQPNGVASDGTRIYVSDQMNNRIAQWNSFPVANGTAMSAVQAKSAGANALFDPTKSCGTNGVAKPGDVVIGGGRMAVADNNRVLLWNSVPTSPNTPPDMVLGKSTFTDCTPPVTVDATTLENPSGVWVSANKVVIADTNRNRVLIWTSWPATNGAAADVVIGQASMTTWAAGVGSTGLDAPGGVYADPAGSKLLVADTGNNRVIGFTTFPTASGAAANRVFGQPDLGATSVGSGCGAAKLNSPTDVWTDGTKVAVSDADNHRVLFFDTWPASNLGVNADGVFGHAAFNVCSHNNGGSSISGNTLRVPTDVWSDGSRVLVADRYNHRVLSLPAWPSGTTNTAAGFVLGHDSMTKAGAYDFNRNLTFPHEQTSLDEHGIWPTAIPGGGLLVETADTHVGMYWSTTPAATNTNFSWRLHQTSDVHTFYNDANNSRSATSANYPQGSWSDGTKLMVTDQENNRILIYNSLPSGDNPTPDAVIGQADFTSGGTNTTQSGLDDPHAVASDGTKVAVADQNNNRVLIWNSIPTTGSAGTANVVLGQPNFTASTANNGGRSAATMSGPVGVTIWNGKLLVSDKENHRILVWNSIPTTNFVPADAIIGQASAGAASSGTDTHDVVGISASANAVFWTHDCETRVLDPIPKSGFVSNVSSNIGSPSCVTDSSWTQSRTSFASGVSALAGSVWVGEDYGARVVRWDDTTTPTITAAPTATVRCDGTVTINFTTSESTVSTVYYDTVSRGGTYTSYASSVSEPSYTGLGHAVDLSFPTPGTRYAMVRAVDWNNQAVTSSEISFTVPTTCPAPINMLGDDANAQSGTGRTNPSSSNAPAIASTTFHTSWQQSSGVTMDSLQSQTWSTPPEHAAGMWHMDGATAADANALTSGAITWTGSPGYTSGRFGQGIALNASQYGTIPDASALRAANNFTFDAWFNTTDITNASFPIIAMKSNGSCGPGDRCNYSLEFDSASNALCATVITTAATERQACGSAAGLTDGTWHWAAMTMTSSNQLSLYVDGALAAGPVAAGAPARTGADPLTLGDERSHGGNKYVGAIDELRFAPIAYDAAAIAGYYRTRRAHLERLWNPATITLGSNCATTSRCEDQTYAGQPDFLRAGARYWQRTRFNTLNNDYWSDWGSDWFETAVSTSLNVTVGSAVDFGTVLAGADAFADTVAQVSTNNAGGYQLSAHDESDTWGLERVGGGPTVPDRQNGAVAPAAWPSGVAGYFGVTVRDATGGRLAKWGTGTGWPSNDTANNLYTGLEASTDVVLHQRTSYAAATDTVSITWRSSPTASQTAGAYDGVVTLTAIATP